MKKSIIILSLLTSLVISNNSNGINCADPATIATSSCTTQPTQLMLSPATYSEVTTLSPNPCCLKNCVSNSNFNGTNCVCNDTYYYDSPSNTCKSCSECGVTNGTAIISTVNNLCYYTVNCNTGFELSVNNCASANYGSCIPGVYEITLNDNGGGGGDGTIYQMYATRWTRSSDGVSNPITTFTIPTKNKNRFIGYYQTHDGSGLKLLPTGDLQPAANVFTENTTVYAKWSECSGTLVSGGNGQTIPVNNLVNNVCMYYAKCEAGYVDIDNYDSDHPGIYTDLKCDPCPAGYYCPGELEQLNKCPGGMTSPVGSDATNDCYYQAGASGTKFCDSNGCLHLPINIVY